MRYTSCIRTAFVMLIGFWMGEAQECGRPQLLNRIVGGSAASEGAWPWQVDIQTDSQGHVCGGTIISENWVLSAAHCFPNPNDISSYMVYVGRQQLNGWNPDETSHRVCRVVVPLGYTDPQLGQDIALVELATAVGWSERIQPICLPYANVEFSSDMRCMISGWGDIRDGVALQGVGALQEVQVPIIDSKTCQDMFLINPTENIDIGHDMMCAGFQQGGKDSCQGDSGGPLVCQISDGSWVQAGIVSFGLGCAKPNRPGVYAKVSSFTNFIQNHVGGVQLKSASGHIWADRVMVLIRTLVLLVLVQLLR
ncbi:serine protease 33-like [Sinocyclocheilus anshuiensis]|uniref:Serine protease 33-like n=1 Tax=Sinocyclocheilus anshuiensis TaxID=1608454 RepID=A0A671R8Z6_9TELE|nr:PREDICTED: serine protease 33-like [Sinocyclocheilus anshuiensis]